MHLYLSLWPLLSTGPVQEKSQGFEFSSPTIVCNLYVLLLIRLAALANEDEKSTGATKVLESRLLVTMPAMKRCLGIGLAALLPKFGM